jgi:hypothetical protein
MTPLRHHHPLLFASFPTLFLLANNWDAVPLADGLLPLAVSVAAAAALFATATALTGDAERAAIAASLILLFVFTYGAAAEMVHDVSIGSVALGRARVLLPAWSLLALASLWVSHKLDRRRAMLTRGLTIMAWALVIWSGARLAWSRLPTDLRARGAAPASPEARVTGPAATRRDMYYIILDGYASEATLRDLFGFDNRPFLNRLRDRGFVVASGSRSNYALTLLSIASSLNMRYVGQWSAMPPGHANEDPHRLIRDNEVMRLLRRAGYRIVNHGSGDEATSRMPLADVNLACGGLTEIGSVLLGSTMLGPLVGDRASPRGRLLCTFAALGRAPRTTRPTFHFAHILAPHPPYTFRRDCTRQREVAPPPEGPWAQRPLYVEQLECVNRLVLELLDRLSRPEGDAPIIILQADHGPASLLGGPRTGRWEAPTPAMLTERFGILNALQLPGGGAAAVYDSITPVNAFRLILDRYLGATLPLLPDMSLFSTYDRPDSLRLVSFWEPPVHGASR